ncbi:MAG: ROK family transcriptional regulator [Defluviitaleaceae bacterium]|nr:ROK family transcriptional regulator [Defluviitaleaceae bacterium]
MRSSVNHDVRVNNGKMITDILFTMEPMTKQELIELTKMSPPTVTAVLKHLQESGLIAHGEKLKSTGGRPAQLIMPVYNAAHSIGIFVSPNHIRICATNLAPSIVAKAKYDLAMENTPEYWERVYDYYLKFKKDFKVSDKNLLGIGITMNTMPDRETKVLAVISGNKRITLNSQYIFDAFSNCGIEVQIRNEAKMAALAHARDNSSPASFTYLSVNNNVAGAIVSDRNVVRYASRNAEFGHMIVDYDGKLCVCGMKGCFDAYISATSIQAESGLSLQDFFVNLSQGDAKCGKIWDNYLNFFTIFLSNIRVAFDSNILIGGIMSQYLARYRHELERRLYDLQRPHLEEGEFHTEYIYISDLGEYSSAMGAGLLYNDRFLAGVFN